MCSFCRLTNRYFCTFDLSSEQMHDRCSVLHGLICTFYYQESVETIKMDAPGDFFSLRCIDLLLYSQQEAVCLCEGSVVWMGKVSAFFLFLRYKPVQSFLGSVVHGGSEIWTCFIPPPLSLTCSLVSKLEAMDQVGFSCLLNHKFKLTISNMMTGNLIQIILWMQLRIHRSYLLLLKHVRIWWLWWVHLIM